MMDAFFMFKWPMGLNIYLSLHLYSNIGNAVHACIHAMSAFHLLILTLTLTTSASPTYQMKKSIYASVPSQIVYAPVKYGS
jgi:hypothetical protein